VLNFGLSSEVVVFSCRLLLASSSSFLAQCRFGVELAWAFEGNFLPVSCCLSKLMKIFTDIAYDDENEEDC